jgi:transposase InsO family protein
VGPRAAISHSGSRHLVCPVFLQRIRATGIRDHSIAPRSPWQNAYIERLIGSIRRECLDHMIVFDEAHLHRILRGYAPMRVLKKKLLAKGITPVNFAGVKATFYRRADVDPVVPSS